MLETLSATIKCSWACVDQSLVSRLFKLVPKLVSPPICLSICLSINLNVVPHSTMSTNGGTNSEELTLKEV